MSKLLTTAEAATQLGITEDELIRSRQRGLPPGALGFRPAPGEPLVWRSEDLTPKKGSVDEQPETEGELPDLMCPICGFTARSAGGLTTHQRSHS